MGEANGAVELFMPSYPVDEHGSQLDRGCDHGEPLVRSTQPAGAGMAIGESTNKNKFSDEPMPQSRVRKEAHACGLYTVNQGRLRIKKHVVLQALSGAPLILLIAGLFIMKGNEGQTHAAFEHAVSQRIADMQSEDTERYVIQPIEPFYGGGLVWLKRGSGEMLIVVNGLHSLEEKDYQVWLQDEDRLSSAGFMLVQGPQGKSYYYGYGAEKAKRIVVSMEPKGEAGDRPGPKPFW